MSSRTTTTSNPMTPGATGTMTISLEKIAMRAYEKWCKRGCPHGSDQRDWYEAETELRMEMGRTGAIPAGGAAMRR